MEVQTSHYEFNEKKKQIDTDKSRHEQYIENIIQKEGYISYDVQQQNFTTEGGNYLGKLCAINIKGQTKHGEKETPIFLKQIIPNTEVDFMSLNKVYETELFVYTELMKEFDEIQDDAEIPDKERFRGVKFYEESDSTVIILEDLTKRGFRTWNRMDCASLNMAEACIQQLAKFHGLSFAMKEKRSKYFENKIKKLEQPFMFDDKAWPEFMNKFTTKALEYVDEELRRKIEGQIRRAMDKYPDYYKDDVLQSCLCHGDYRPNNVMIKEEEGKIIKATPVDYQMVFYGCPVLDFLYFLYTGTDFKFRTAHFDHLKDLYFETLKNFLIHFDVKVKLVYPRERFEKELKERRDYGLMVSVCVLQFMFVSENDVPDLADVTSPDCEVVLDERYRERLLGAIQEFIELGYLKV